MNSVQRYEVVAWPEGFSHGLRPLDASVKEPVTGTYRDSSEYRRGELADRRDRVADLRDDAADVRDDLADKRDEMADQRDRSSKGGALAFNVESLRAMQVAGPWGYRFGAIEQETGGAIRAQIIDGDGCEVAWAKGDTKRDLFLDASHKAHEHEAHFDKRQGNS